MKRAASHLASLQGLLDREITVALVSEDLHAVSAVAPASEVQKVLEERGFDECGVDRGDSICEYVERTTLREGTVGDHARRVPLERVVATTTPLWACMERLAAGGPLYVLGDHGLEGIVTRFDLSKQPARLLMFGVVSLLELTMLALIRRVASETWQGCLTPARMEAAETLHAERRRRGEEIDLMDCIQLSDKVTVFLKTDNLKAILGGSRSSIEDQFKSLQRIRDKLAHAQSPAMNGDWAAVIATLRRGHTMLGACVSALATGLAMPDSAQACSTRPVAGG